MKKNWIPNENEVQLQKEIYMKLKDMEIGSNAKIIKYNTKDRNYRQKLLRMGLIKGTTFTIVRKAPLGDPIEIRLSGFNLTLRKTEADALEVEKI